MPRIEYDESIIAATQANILHQIAAIEELLKGRMDTDNIYDSNAGQELASVYVVRDMPAPKRFVNNCFKLFFDTSNFNAMWVNGVLPKLNNNTELTFIKASGSVTLTTTAVYENPQVLTNVKSLAVKKPTNYYIVREERLQRILRDNMGSDINDHVFHDVSYDNADIGLYTKRRPVFLDEVSITSKVESSDTEIDTINPNIINYTIHERADEIGVDLQVNITDPSIFGDKAEERMFFVDVDLYILCEVCR